MSGLILIEFISLKVYKVFSYSNFQLDSILHLIKMLYIERKLFRSRRLFGLLHFVEV